MSPALQSIHLISDRSRGGQHTTLCCWSAGTRDNVARLLIVEAECPWPGLTGQCVPTPGLGTFLPYPGSPRSPLSSVHTVAVTGRGINNKIRGHFHNIRIRRLLASASFFESTYSIVLSHLRLFYNSIINRRLNTLICKYLYRLVVLRIFAVKTMAPIGAFSKYCIQTYLVPQNFVDAY